MTVMLSNFPDDLSDDFKRIAGSLRPRASRNAVMMVILENFIQDERAAESPREFVEQAINRSCKPTLAPAGV